MRERVEALESGASALGEQAIAARALKERYILRALGFRRNQKVDEADGRADSDGGETSEGAAAPPAQPVLALPARASSPADMRRSSLA